MNFAINLKSVVCKVWLAILLAAIVHVSLLDSAHAQAKAQLKTPGKAAKAATKTPEKEGSNTTVAKGPTLALEDFLNQVRSGNGAFKASDLAVEGSSQAANEYKLLTRPTLVGSAGYKDDRAETGSALLGDIQRGYNYSLGIRQVTDFGLSGTLSYKQGWASLPQANPTFVQNNYYTGSPVLELNQSLWRNGFGSEIRATKELSSAQALELKYNSSFQQKQILADAETAYWRLALAREAVDLAKENLTLSERLRGWSSGRQRSGLGDRSDFLQADTASLARQLEFKNALDEEKAASRAFNTTRGVDSEVVSETLVAFDSDVIDKRMRLPQREALRDDVKAAEQTARRTAAQAKLGAEKNKPTVDVFGTVAYNGREGSKYEAQKESFTDDHPTYAVGLKLEVPLDIGTSSDVVKGYKAEARAAQLTYERKKFESDRTWKDLSQGLQDSLARYRLAAQIEKAQREKMEYERVRHGRGRSTTFQVIQFETDYATAQLNRIRTQFDILNQYAKLKTFAGGSQ